MCAGDYLVAFLSLSIGSMFLSTVYESVAGNRSFSLPFGNVALVTVAGLVLFPFLGWMAVLGVLIVYGIRCLVAGWMDR